MTTSFPSLELPDQASPDLFSEPTHQFMQVTQRMDHAQAPVRLQSQHDADEHQNRQAKKRHRPGESGESKRPKRNRKREAQASDNQETAQRTVPPLVIQANSLNRRLPAGNEHTSWSMSDALNAVCDAFDNVFVPAIEGMEKTVVAKLRLRMIRYVTLNYVKKQLEEKHANKVVTVDDIAQYTADSLVRFNYTMSVV